MQGVGLGFHEITSEMEIFSIFQYIPRWNSPKFFSLFVWIFFFALIQYKKNPKYFIAGNPMCVAIEWVRPYHYLRKRKLEFPAWEWGGNRTAVQLQGQRDACVCTSDNREHSTPNIEHGTYNREQRIYVKYR